MFHHRKHIMSTTSNTKQKKCSACEQTKPLSDFYRGSKCKECFKAQQRERNKQNREEELRIKNDPELQKQTKECKICGKVKSINEFRVKRGECKDCERSYGRQYNEEHHDIRQKWTDEHKERRVELAADWYQKNKPKICEKRKCRYNEDACFRIHHICKTQLQNHIRKIKSTDDYIGTKCERVANWLETNFTDEMQWDNHGTVWDIDHVIPISKWDLSDQKQVEMCFNWKNISPSPCNINRNQKREKIDLIQVMRHLRNLRKYFADNDLDQTELDDYIRDFKTQLGKYTHKC